MARAKGDALVRNVADQEQVDEATRVVADRTNRDRRNVQLLLATPEGRGLYRWLIDFCGPQRQPHAGEATHETSFNCGQLNVALRLRALAEQCAPDNTLLMWKEALKLENA